MPEAIDSSVYAFARQAVKQGKRPTVEACATQLGVSRSTVHRAACRLGFGGWSDLVEQLERYHHAPAQPSSTDLLATSINTIADALMRHQNDPILIRAVGDCEICAGYLLLRLGERSLHALPYSESTLPTHPGHNSQHGGLLIAINESGITLLPSCRKAAEHAFETIAVTARSNTPLAKLANVSISIKNAKSSTDSYLANYFTAGVLALFERVFMRIDQLREAQSSEAGVQS